MATKWPLENGLFSILRSLSQIAINEETAAFLVSLSAGIHVSYSGNSSDYYFWERLFTCDNLLSYRGFQCEDYVFTPIGQSIAKLLHVLLWVFEYSLMN